MWINPKHPGYRVLAADQGTTVSVNGGATWSHWYNQATGQFYHVAADNRFPYWVYSGQQDCGSARVASRSDYGQITFRDWHPVGADERDYDVPDPENPDVVYGSGLGGRLSKWNARNGRVENVSPWPVSSYAAKPSTVKYRYTWITPIAISSRPPHAIYQGSQFLFQSLDKGKTWKIISPDLSIPNPNAKDCEENVSVQRATECGYGVIFSIAPSPVVDGLIWIGTDNGRIHLTRDNGKTWENVTPAAITDWSKIASIDASPADPATAYVAVDRHRLDDRHPYIYRTHDFGRTWTSVSNEIPEESWVNVVRQDSRRKGLLYAGTRTGVFVSFDDGDHWQPLQLNLPRTGVNDLFVHQNDVVIATQGRALWVLDDITPLRNFDFAQLTAGAQLSSPAPAVRLSTNENRDTPLPPEVPTTPNPPSGAIIDYYLPEKPDSPVLFEIVNTAGSIIRTFRSDDQPKRTNAQRYFAEQWLQPLPVLPTKTGHNRFVWDLHHALPKVPEYEYSIAAVPGRDTPALPQGMLVLPGEYTLQLTVSGKTITRPLKVVQDPRSTVKLEDMQAQLSLYEKAVAVLSSTPEPSEQEKKEKPQHASAIQALLALVIDLEQADGPPTQPQQDVYNESLKILQAAVK